MEFFPQDWNAKEMINKDIVELISHGICVSNLAFRIANELELSDEKCYELSIAGLLHDIGKVQLSGYLSGQKEEALMIEKLKYVRMHSKLSHRFLQQYHYTDFILNSILYHHENYDGSGYPDNLRGEAIPYGARILRVSDVFTALISNRPYRSAFDIDTAIELMIEEVKNYDMKVFLAFLKIIHEEDVVMLLADA